MEIIHTVSKHLPSTNFPYNCYLSHHTVGYINNSFPSTSFSDTAKLITFQTALLLTDPFSSLMISQPQSWTSNNSPFYSSSPLSLSRLLLTPRGNSHYARPFVKSHPQALHVRHPLLQLLLVLLASIHVPDVTVPVIAIFVPSKNVPALHSETALFQILSSSNLTPTQRSRSTWTWSMLCLPVWTLLKVLLWMDSWNHLLCVTGPVAVAGALPDARSQVTWFPITSTF